MLYGSTYIKWIYSDRKQISGCLGKGPGVEKKNYKGAEGNFGVIDMFYLNCGNDLMDVYMSNISNCTLLKYTVYCMPIIFLKLF